MHNEKSIFKIVINLWMGVIRCVQPQIAFRVRNIKFDKYAERILYIFVEDSLIITLYWFSTLKIITHIDGKINKNRGA